MEYLAKKDTADQRKLFESWIDKIRKNIKSNGITFTCELVGSAKRHMVIAHHNKGFDLDYQIRIQKNKKNLEPKEIKKLFMNELNKVTDSKLFEDCEDSTSVITIKQVNASEAKINFGFDVSILQVFSEKGEDVLKILRNDKVSNVYKFEQLKDLSAAFANYQKIQGVEMISDLRERYLKKKETNTENKKSFQLFYEAVNETLQKFNIKLTKK